MSDATGDDSSTTAGYIKTHLLIRDNYQYDEIGNLIKDGKEGIDTIEWTVYGKISKIVKGSMEIRYSYDATGNRISKEVDPAVGATPKTYYVRDGSGNVMSVYEEGGELNEGNLSQSEVHLYGSSRLGIFKRAIDMTGLIAVPDGVFGYERGHKFFELSNHLGNVLVTVTDRKNGVAQSVDTTLVDYYLPDMASASDYYPFGMGMPGRKFTSGNEYRYSMNGQEKEKELNENITSAEFWMYDSRIVRRWNPDPVYQHSPYSVFANNPISFVDPDGADTVNITRTTTRIVGGSMGGGLDGVPSIKIPDIVSSTGNINIRQAEGQDVFIFTQVNITTENGVTTTTSSSTTLDIRGKFPDYRAGSSIKGFHNDYFALASMAPGWLLDHYAEKNRNFDFPTWKGASEAKALQSTIPFANRLNQVANVAYTVFGTTSLISGVLSMSSKGIAYTTVGRWMSQAELKAMNTTGMIQQGAGGQTFVTTGGASSYMGAARGSVYVEFQVPTRSLLQGGKDGWFKMIGPDASKTMKYQLDKQGGEMLPQFKNLTGVLKTK